MILESARREENDRERPAAAAALLAQLSRSEEKIRAFSRIFRGIAGQSASLADSAETDRTAIQLRADIARAAGQIDELLQLTLGRGENNSSSNDGFKNFKGLGHRDSELVRDTLDRVLAAIESSIREIEQAEKELESLRIGGRLE